jgi:inosine-uridine nucleoside N-ribohydrolase
MIHESVTFVKTDRTDKTKHRGFRDFFSLNSHNRKDVENAGKTFENELFTIRTKMSPIEVIFDMETQDPDDFLTLILLCGHPQVVLKAVTIVPGSPQQIGLVRWLLSQFSRYNTIPVGYFNIQSKPSVSAWHYKMYGEIPPSTHAEPACDIIFSICEQNRSTIILTGGPLKNIAKTIEEKSTPERPFRVETMVIQGGFAGCNVVPEEHQLSKFKDMVTCQTFNLGADIPAARKVISYPFIERKYFVSKNVCHGVTYNKELDDLISSLSRKPIHLEMIQETMSKYGKEKKLHDPFAACCAINREIGTWEEVDLYCERDEKRFFAWGSRKVDYPTGVFIIVNYDKELFLETFCMTNERTKR